MQIWISRYGPWIIFPTSSSTELWLSKVVPYNSYTSKLIQITFNWNEGSYSHFTAIVLGSRVNSGNNFNTSEALLMFGMFSLQLFERPQKPRLQISIWIIFYLPLQVFCLFEIYENWIVIQINTTVLQHSSIMQFCTQEPQIPDHSKEICLWHYFSVNKKTEQNKL